jgi:hypothetical protein
MDGCLYELPFPTCRQTLTSKPEQQWYIKEGNNTQIQLAATTLCLDAGAKSQSSIEVKAMQH